MSTPSLAPLAAVEAVKEDKKKSQLRIACVVGLQQATVLEPMVWQPQTLLTNAYMPREAALIEAAGCLSHSSPMPFRR